MSAENLDLSQPWESNDSYIFLSQLDSVIADNIETLPNIAGILISKDGKIICLTYQSLEDKIVKDFFNDISLECICDFSSPICNCEIQPEFKIGKPKKIKPSKLEVQKNPKSKSVSSKILARPGLVVTNPPYPSSCHFR